MKLNMDCVRSILLCAEENTSIRKPCLLFNVGPDSNHIRELLGKGTYSSEVPDYEVHLLDKYDSDELFYHIRYCQEADLIRCNGDVFTEYLIDDLTVKGHEFVNGIRDEKLWNKTKSIAAKIGAKSLDVFVQIASNVITELIKAELGIR